MANDIVKHSSEKSCLTAKTVEGRAINIYLITNLVNGKQYVGQTVKTIEQRFYQHCYKSKTISPTCISGAIKKYGKENFEITLLEIVKASDAVAVETKYIIQYDTFKPNGYNLAVPMKHERNTVRITEEDRQGRRERAIKNNKQPKTELQIQNAKKTMRYLHTLPKSEKQKQSSREKGKLGALVTRKKVIVLDHSTGMNKEFGSHTEAEKYYKIPPSTISCCLKDSNGFYRKRNMTFYNLPASGKITGSTGGGSISVPFYDPDKVAIALITADALGDAAVV